MRKLLEYIVENFSSSNVNLLANYIYNQLYGLAANDNLDDEVVLEISFKDIDGFDETRYELVRPEKSISTKDMLVVFDATGDTYGYMSAGQAMLFLNFKFFKTTEKMDKYRVIIMNTLLHELTHYIQFSVGEKKGLKYSLGMDSYDKDLEAAILNSKKTEMQSYYLLSFFIYAFDKTEMDARRTGLWANLENDWSDERLKKFANKKANDSDVFVDRILRNKKYNNNELHLQVFDNIINRIEKDTWDNYYKAYGSEDPLNDYSTIYCICNLFDHLKDPNDLKAYTVPIPLPAKKDFAAALNTEEKFNKYKQRLLKHCKIQMKYYKKKLTKIIKQFYKEKSAS